MRSVVFHVLVLASVIAYSSCQLPRFDPTDCLTLPDGSKIESPFLCNQFFVCDGGMLSEEGSCPKNMLFNPDSKVCDFPENVDCKEVPLPPEFETETPSDTTQTTESESPITPSTKCPLEDPEEPIFLPVENDCSSYILCFHGKDIVKSCPPNMYWNSESFECDNSSAHCKQTDKFGCPAEGIDFLPHPGSCKKFIYCRDGYSREQSCSFLKVFDSNEKTCIFGTSC